MNGARRVTVGVPVRNGAATLSHALDSLLRQTHTDLDIVICDNASTDETADVARRFMELDDRIRYMRQDHPVTVTANWATAYRAAKAPYFMWASDDDLRSDDFVQRLLEALERDPDVGLAFGEVYKFNDYDRLDTATPYHYTCSTRGIPVWKRLVMDKNGPFAPYGVFRTEVLARYRWYEHTVSPDWPLFIFILLVTDIVQVRGARFYYREGAVAVPAEQRAREQSYREIEKYPTLRLSWRCALAARDAAAVHDRRRFLILDFTLVFFGLLWQNRRLLVRWALKRY